MTSNGGLYAKLVLARADWATARAALRTAEDDHRFERARAEVRALAERPEIGNGRNAEERARLLEITLAEDAAYRRCLRQLRGCQEREDQARADLDNLLDLRRDREVAVRERLAALVERGLAVEADNVRLRVDRGC